MKFKFIAPKYIVGVDVILNLNDELELLSVTVSGDYTYVTCLADGYKSVYMSLDIFKLFCVKIN